MLVPPSCPYRLRRLADLVLDVALRPLLVKVRIVTIAEQNEGRDDRLPPRDMRLDLIPDVSVAIPIAQVQRARGEPGERAGVIGTDLQGLLVACQYFVIPL